MADEESRADSYARHLAEHENPWRFATCIWCRDERRIEEHERSDERYRYGEEP